MDKALENETYPYLVVQSLPIQKVDHNFILALVTFIPTNQW